MAALVLEGPAIGTGTAGLAGTSSFSETDACPASAAYCRSLLGAALLLLAIAETGTIGHNLTCRSVPRGAEYLIKPHITAEDVTVPEDESVCHGQGRLCGLVSHALGASKIG